VVVCFRQTLWRKSKHTFCVQRFLFCKNSPIYEIMCKNILDPDTRQMTNVIPHMRIACWIPKPTNTHSEYVILHAFPLQQLWHECASVLCYMYINCPLKSFSSFSPSLTWNLCSIVIVEEPCWTVWGSNVVRGKKLYSFPKFPYQFMGPPSTLLHWYWGFLPVGKVVGA
jgi:hypothetical protein